MRTLILFCLLLPGFARAQVSDYFTIKGAVVHERTGEPLSHAHVGIPDRGIGTTTGYDGGFLLKLPAYYKGATLTVSYLGFKTYRIPVRQIRQPFTVRLQPSPATLQEVIVMDEQKVEDIIRKAVRRIPENYPDYPTSMQGFYRESKTDADGAYIYLAEGVLDLYKRSYQNEKEGQVGLIQGRQVGLVSEEELRAQTGFSSGHLASDRFDIVKNREDFIDERYFEAYKYWVENITTHNDAPVYVIGFDRAEGAYAARMKGRVFIDTLTFAFIRAEFEILPDAQRKYNDYPLYTGNWKGNRYFVNYRQVNGHWHLSEALREGFWRDGGVYTNELIVTEVKPGRGKTIPYMERLGRDERFLSLTGTYDENFWASYNTAPINDRALAETVQQLNNQSKANEVFDTTFMNQLQRQRDSVAAVSTTTTRAADSTAFAYTAPAGGFQQEISKWGFHFSYGLGAHFLHTAAGRYELQYLSQPEAAPILAVDETIDARAFEPQYQIATDITYKGRYVFRFDFTRDFTNSIYRASAVGAGLQFNLTKRYRPFFVRPLVQYSRLLYGRKVGQADNDFGNFKAEGKNFKASKVNMYYGSRVQNLMLTLEMALELNPGRELFLRAGYRLPFQHRQRLFLWERKRVFRKRAELPVDHQVVVRRDGVPFEGAIDGMEPALSLTIGILSK